MKHNIQYYVNGIIYNKYEQPGRRERMRKPIVNKDAFGK